MAGNSISRGIENYLEKINCLIACLNCSDWILNASPQSIETLFDSAYEIEGCLSREEAQKINESLKIVYPDYNFTRCGDIVLETFLIHPQSGDNSILCAMNKYLDVYSKYSLCNVIFRLIQSKRIKAQAICIIRRFKNEDLVRILEAKSCLHLWEQMILEKNVNFDIYLRDMLEKETPLFLDCFTMSPVHTGQVVCKTLIKHLNNENDFKAWFTLLNYRNIKITSLLCTQYSELMEALLLFFGKYASQSEWQEGKSFSWNHKVYPLSEFVDILHFLLTNDGIVGVTVNEFINKQINNFTDYYTFWLDVKALL